MFAKIEFYFNSLKGLVSGHGYYPEPSKIVLIVHPDNLEAGKLFVLSRSFKVCTGGFIGDDKSKNDCLGELTKTWEQKITNTRKTTV